MAVRAGILVTGTEVITARITDRNGPWLSERLGELGVEVAYRDPRALGGQRPRGRQANPAGSARDRDDLSLKRTRWRCHVAPPRIATIATYRPQGA